MSYVDGPAALLSTSIPTFIRWAVWATPRQGWTTFALWLAVGGVVAWTVKGAAVAETPGLMSVIVASSLVGMLLSKAKGPRPLIHLAALAIGLGFVLWQTLLLIEAQPLGGRVGELWDRLGEWYEAAAIAGSSTDLLPLAAAVSAGVWLLGYVGAWFIFRRNNVWVGLLVLGTVFMTIREYTDDDSLWAFYLFLFLALLLVARVSLVQRVDQWKMARISSIPGTARVSLGVTAIASVLLLGVVASLPENRGGWATVNDLWQLARSPVYWIENKIDRMYGTSGAALGGRYFEDQMSFEGPRATEEELVFVAESEHPSYWQSQTYSRYTSGGWASDSTERGTTGPDSLAPPPHDPSDRVEVLQDLQLTLGTENLLSGGNVGWVSRGAEFETLKPKQFEINLFDTFADDELTADVQRLAMELRRRFIPLPRDFVESQVSSMLPLDLLLLDTSVRGDSVGRSSLESVTLKRTEPDVPDIVSWRSLERIDGGDSYTMRSFVSKASYRDLRTTPMNYSGFIMDHYLTLPAELPRRVRELAILVAGDAQAPVDRALRIQDFLRGDRFTYSVDIEKPPGGVDGVDHFLFESGTGYCDYFASAMVVMLRAVGVPARLAAGYAPGHPVDGTDQRRVMTTDSHSWPQVYFPDHGWIDFEPTPNRPVPDRGPEHADPQLDSTSGAERLDTQQGLLEACLEQDFLFPIDEARCAALVMEAGLGLPSTNGLSIPALDGGTSNEASERSTGPVVLVVVAGAAVAGLFLIGWLVWTLSLPRATVVEAVYAKMTRMGTLAGIRRRPNQTPI